MSTTLTATPDRIVEIATGYMGAKLLFAASRVGMFKALADGDRTAGELAVATGVSERMAQILADAMNSQGLLERREGRYSLAADAAEYLGGSGSLDLEPFLTFLNRVSYGHWMQFDTTVDTGGPGHLERDDAVQAVFAAGVPRYFALHALMLARTFDFTEYRAMLDLGGISPEFAINALRANAALKVRCVVGAGMAAGFEDAFAACHLADRASVDIAEPGVETPGGEYDIVLVSHVIHRFEPALNRVILAAARAAVSVGSTLVLLDFLLDKDGRQRPVDALHAGEYAVIDGTIVYPEAEVLSWIEVAGWKVREVLALPGSPRAVVAVAV